MKVFLIILMVLAILFAIYEGVMLVITIVKRVHEKRQKSKDDNSSVVDADRKEK